MKKFYVIRRGLRALAFGLLLQINLLSLAQEHHDLDHYFKEPASRTIESPFMTNQMNSNYLFVDSETFHAKYSHLKWMHIGRLQRFNPGLNLRDIDPTFDCSSIKFNHNVSEDFAYRLYNGDFLIVLSN